MARKIEIEINNVLYVGDTSPAKDQVEMLCVATQNGMLPFTTKEVKDMTVVSGIAALNPIALERLKELVIRKGGFKRVVDSVPVGENLFQDEVHLFLLLLGRGLAENIGPFWNLSKIDNVEVGAQAK
ncbi:hypothetical protein D3C75_861370 [compost metagenome]